MDASAAAESFWFFALPPKFEPAFVSPTLFCLLLILLGWLAAGLLHWSFPGGPAWGSYLSLQSTKIKRMMKQSPNCTLIPGPRGLPLVGSARLMTGLAHRKLADEALRRRAGRLMALSVGQTRMIVTCHPDVAREILHSPAFGDRPAKETAYALMFHRAIGFAPSGPYWRSLRRIASTNLLCPRQLAASEPQRRRVAAQLSAAVLHKGGCPFLIRGLLKRASLSSMMSSVFGRSYDLWPPAEEAEEVSCLVEEGYGLLAELNWADHLPFLAGFDPMRIRSRCAELVPRVNRFVNRLLNERRSQTGRPASNRDFLDALLSLQGSDRLSDPDMVAVLWEMIFRGTDTVAVLIEWVLARLLLHPDIQRKVHQELDSVVGKSRPVTESDLPALPYLQAVIKETLRLHPPGPLLSWARLAVVDTVVDGRQVPAGTTAMVNMWAISRDPGLWDQPESFRPERFVEGGADAGLSVLGSDLRLAPFGSGRRSCPGKALGMATAGFWVASLLQEFEWAEGEGEGQRVRLSEVLRLSCEMAAPLTAKARRRR